MDDEKTPPTGPGKTTADTGATPDRATPTGAEPAAPAKRRGGWDRTTRNAALVAALVALPVTVAVAGFTFNSLSSDEPAATPSPSESVQALGPKATTPVQMAAEPLAERPATVCRALLAKLPSTVRELPQRPVTAGPEQNAAYGDPALTVSCGVPEPAIPATDTVWVVEQVCWHASEQSDVTVLTTVDREAAVRVTVPKRYEQPLQWVSPISEAIVASILTAGPVPSGCRG
ncbi:DUF3515 family protein [Micromonospora sagamiensis]|uniref:Uncharacterized protein DUF3515 n=1 Tax=Micromonospora sagamiensis TaxID=47875 RepID=A0A562WLL3_9ACTN|nr:uncharacterized protein DUF3515 [Micromonospora sagamiensis]BCL16187.1 hypothetical protein GCM10017556_39260 [Micromonospora sagamiensis]